MHGQGRGNLHPPGNVVECFYALVTNKIMLSKVSVDEVFMHFQNMSSASLQPQAFTGAPLLNPTEGLSHPDSLICPLLEKMLRAPM